MKRIVVLTGAGVSRESGLKTFRDSDGLWNTYRIEEVATYEAWLANRALVLEFYNMRRKELMTVQPNAAHFALQKLEQKYDVRIITQNVDDLHERAGSSRVLHLHGELKKVRSTLNAGYVKTLEGWELKEGDLCPEGAQLRPHIVWFGESVPMFDEAVRITKTAEMLIVIGTSLNVYPAAGLMHYAPDHCPVWLIDPGEFTFSSQPIPTHIKEPATTGVPRLVEQLLAPDPPTQINENK
ncbi:MAG: NAD-dependent deacylase [Bacteroidales bacterium]